MIKPKVGDKYHTDTEVLTITEVGDQYDDGGYAVLCSDDTWYDCYWDGSRWQYWPPEEADES